MDENDAQLGKHERAAGLLKEAAAAVASANEAAQQAIESLRSARRFMAGIDRVVGPDVWQYLQGGEGATHPGEVLFQQVMKNLRKALLAFDRALLEVKQGGGVAHIQVVRAKEVQSRGTELVYVLVRQRASFLKMYNQGRELKETREHAHVGAVECLLSDLRVLHGSSVPPHHRCSSCVQMLLHASAAPQRRCWRSLMLWSLTGESVTID
jgi:hypothetical protein